MTALTRALFNPPALRDSSANQSRLTAQTELREGVLWTEGGGGRTESADDKREERNTAWLCCCVVLEVAVNEHQCLTFLW